MDHADGDRRGRCMWKPDASRVTNMDRFRDRINKKFHLKLETYADFFSWSIENYASFWEELWHFAEIKYSTPFSEVVDTKKGIQDIPEWFRDCRLNFAENMLKYKDDNIAIYSSGEGLDCVQEKTFAELHDDVGAYAAALRACGITKGDRVVGYLPNGIEAVVAMLATASIGAIWSSTSPEFGVSGVLERFSQIQPRVIFSVNAVKYNGKIYDHLEKLTSVVDGLPDLEKVIIIPNILVGKEDNIDISCIKNSCLVESFLTLGVAQDGSVPVLHFEQLPFNHPLVIMYSSGTTGPPKCIVHSTGGTLLKHIEEHLIQGNITRKDKIMYYTTTGWMMWNWFVGALALGSSIVCYDGSPLVPHANVLWDLVEEIGITVLGTGAKWLSVLEDRGVKPKETHNLQSLHTILSTGSPLKPQSYEYVYRDIKSDVLLGSITGGTDIIACFAGQNYNLPVYSGEIQSRNLGMAVECWDESGKAVLDESGELVCTKPFPSMPTQFWNDPNNVKYKKAYFMKYPGVWAHGDFCLISSETGGMWMLGRSDGTLNPNGVRFGSAEIYHIVESFKEIADSLCVCQLSADRSEERVVLFIKMAPGSVFNESIVKQLRVDVRMQLSARHMPAIILETKDIPYTHSGKKVEVAVKKILAGEDVQQRGAFSNPDSLDLYYNLPELSGY